MNENEGVSVYVSLRFAKMVDIGTPYYYEMLNNLILVLSLSLSEMFLVVVVVLVFFVLYNLTFKSLAKKSPS